MPQETRSSTETRDPPHEDMRASRASPLAHFFAPPVCAPSAASRDLLSASMRGDAGAVRASAAGALEPFPTPVRTLDALHLASVDFRRQGRTMQLASYDDRTLEAAAAIEIKILAV